MGTEHGEEGGILLVRCFDKVGLGALRGGGGRHTK